MFRHTRATILTMIILFSAWPVQAAGDDPPPPKFGVFLAFSENTARVTDVVSDSVAEEFGVRKGDIILKLNDQVINTQDDADAFLKDCSKLKYALYQRKSDNKKVEITVAKSPYSAKLPAGGYRSTVDEFTKKVLP
jgi:S1-C subfamily serine protease